MSAHRIDSRHVLWLDDVDDHLVAGRHLALQSEGYARVGAYYVHRLVMRAKRGEFVDHIDGNRLNCRRTNLRRATKSQNGFNRGKAKHNRSGFKGVYLCQQTGRFRAEIRVNRKAVKLGRFDTPEQAARAYDAAARLYHGAFASPNFLEGSAQ